MKHSKQNGWNRFLALFLALCMIVGYIPLSAPHAHAADGTDTSTESTTTTGSGWVTTTKETFTEADLSETAWHVNLGTKGNHLYSVVDGAIIQGKVASSAYASIVLDKSDKRVVKSISADIVVTGTNNNGNGFVGLVFGHNGAASSDYGYSAYNNYTNFRGFILQYRSSSDGKTGAFQLQRDTAGTKVEIASKELTTFTAADGFGEKLSIKMEISDDWSTLYGYFNNELQLTYSLSDAEKALLQQPGYVGFQFDRAAGSITNYSVTYCAHEWDCTEETSCTCGLYSIDAVADEHTGGTATTTEQAVCEVCGTAYGELAAATLTLDQTTVALDRTVTDPTATQQLTATQAGQSETVVWTTSNADVATVDENGLVTAVGGGTATVTATAGELTATCEVTVTRDLWLMPLTDTEKAALASLSEDVLTAGWNLKNAANYAYSAVGIKLGSYVDQNVAAMVGKVLDSSNGYAPMTGVNKYTVMLLPESYGGSSVTGTSYALSADMLEIGDIFVAYNKHNDVNHYQTAIYQGSGNFLTVMSIANNDCTECSNAPKLATLADLTAESNSWRYYFVLRPSRVSGAFVPELEDFALNLDGSKTLTVKFTAIDSNGTVTEQAVTWSSDNTAVATVDPDTGVVTAVSAGTATITATCNGQTASCVVTVKPVRSLASGELTGEEMAIIADLTEITAGSGIGNAAAEIYLAANINTRKYIDKSIYNILTNLRQKVGEDQYALSDALNKYSMMLLEGTYGGTETEASGAITAEILQIGDLFCGYKKCENATKSHYVTAVYQGEGKFLSVVTNCDVCDMNSKAMTVEELATADTDYIAYYVLRPSQVNGIFFNNMPESLNTYPGATKTWTVGYYKGDWNGNVIADDAHTAFTWSSSNEAVATVADGVVTVLTEGDATITATNGTETYTCTLSASIREIADGALTADEMAGIDALNAIEGVNYEAINWIYLQAGIDTSARFTATINDIRQGMFYGSMNSLDGMLLYGKSAKTNDYLHMLLGGNYGGTRVAFDAHDLTKTAYQTGDVFCAAGICSECSKTVWVVGVYQASKSRWLVVRNETDNTCETENNIFCTTKALVSGEAVDCSSYKLYFVLRPEQLAEEEGDRHHATAVVTDPTCTTRGYSEYTCDICDAECVASYVAPAGHDTRTAGETCGLCGTVIPERGEDEIHVISQNVRVTTTITDTDHSETVVPISERAARMAKLFAELMPDSIGFQEVQGESDGKTWAQELAEKFPDYAYVGVGRDYEGDTSTVSEDYANNVCSGEATPIFYLKDKFDLVEGGTWWLAQDPTVNPGDDSDAIWGATYKMTCTWVVLENKTTGERYAHVNTHLDPGSATARYESAKVVLQKVNELIEEYGADLPVVITGDWNCSQGSDAYNVIIGNETAAIADGAYCMDGQDAINFGKTYHNYAGDALSVGYPVDIAFVTSDNSDVLHYEILTESVDAGGTDSEGNAYGEGCLSDHYAVYMAIETATYTVTWVDEDGTVLETDTDVEYGATPTYDGETPTKEADAQYTYAFNGWDAELAPVTGDVTYTATYTETVNSYTITWVVDGVETTEEYEYGATPEFKGSTDKAADENYTYEFTGWDKEVVAVTGDVTYTAVYEAEAVEEEVQLGTITLKAISLSLEEVVYVNMKVVAADWAADFDFENNMGVLIWTGDKDNYDPEQMVYGNPNVTAYPCKATYEESSGRWVVQTPGIVSTELGVERYMRVYVDGGNANYAYASIQYYSARKYAVYTFAKGTDDVMKRLVAAMLNYGAAAQVNFDGAVSNDPANVITEELARSLYPKYSDEEIANAVAGMATYSTVYTEGMLEDYVPVDTNVVGEFVRDNTICTAKSAALAMDGIIITKYKNEFNDEIMGKVSEVKALFWTEERMKELVEKGETFTEENATTVKVLSDEDIEDGRYVSTYEFASSQLDKTIYNTTVVKTTDGNVYSSGVTAYNPYRYLSGKTSGTDNLAAVCRELIVYGAMAKIAFPEDA